MEKITKQNFEYKMIIKINDLIKANHSKFSEYLYIEKIDIQSIKKSFFSKIASADENKKLILNLAFEYFLINKKYDSSNILEIKKLDPNMLVIINDINNLQTYLELTKSPIDTQYSGGRTLIYTASKCGYLEIVNFLLKKGADPNKVQVNESTCLHVASYYGHYDIVKLLLESGADFNVKNAFGNLPSEECHKEYKKINSLIEKYKDDTVYNFLLDNRSSFSNIKLVINNNYINGKRCRINTSNDYIDWDLAWHGTLIKYIPSIILHGLKRCGEKVENFEIGVRHDTQRIQGDKQFRNHNEWAEAIFTSNSVFYSTSRAYADHIVDCNEEEWVCFLEVRIKPNTYSKCKHTFNNYDLKINEDELVENRSEDSNNVKVIAVWLLKKKLIQEYKDHNLLIRMMSQYIL